MAGTSGNVSTLPSRDTAPLPGRVPLLVAKEAHVWCLPLSLSPSWQDHCLSLLAPDEKERADGFFFEHARQEFIAGRGLLRILLGRYLKVEPAHIQFKYESGRPLLDQPLQFSVSHSDGMGVIMLGLDRVGIDVEHIRPLADMDDLALRFFTNRESAALRPLMDKSKQDVFFKLWTCKEAYLKAVGIGLLGSLDQIEITLDSRATANKGDWQLGNFTPAKDYQAAFAVENPATRILFLPRETKEHPTIEKVDYRLTTNSPVS